MILWLYDVYQNDNYRSFIRNRYDLKGSKYRPRTTWRAMQVFYQLDDSRLDNPGRRLRASGIHLMYQASLMALPFLGLTIANSDYRKSILFGVVSIIFGFVGFRIDRN